MTQADEQFIKTCKEILENGTKKAKQKAEEQMKKIKKAMKIDYE